MREISEATLAILKSQNLTGQNRFTHSLKLEGVDYYTDITDVKTNIMGTGIDCADFCVMSNGKILFLFRIGNTIYKQILNSEAEMMTLPDIIKVADAETLMIVNNVANQRNGTTNRSNFKILRLKNGHIILIVSEIGVYQTQPFKVMVYESASGLGNDFTLISTPYAQTIINSTTGYEVVFNNIGKPVELTNGNLIFLATVPFDYYGSATHSIRAYLSIDGGITWAQKVQWDAGFGTQIGDLKNMINIEDQLLIGVIWDITGVGFSKILYSRDAGQTWAGMILNSGSFGTGGLGACDFCFQQGYLYLFKGVGQNEFNLYRRKADSNLILSEITDASKYEIYQSNLSFNFDIWDSSLLSISPRGSLHFLNSSEVTTDIQMIREEYSAPLNASSISISKGKGGANTATIQASNKDGVLNPKNPDNPLFGVLGTNKQIIIKQGYGTDQIETFTGMIDEFEMSAWPQTTSIALRDNLKKALDQTITDGTQHTLEFASQPIENIVGYLCYLANIETGTIEETGISVAMNFSWCSYADAFQQLGDLASFEWGCDSYGKFYFRRDYQPDNMFVAYTFEEGIDLATLKYKSGDKDLYSGVVVFGKSGDTVISYSAPFLDAALYNILPQKILKIDATEASTVGALQKIAERALSMMQSRTGVIQFTSIAIPWLEVGDFIGIYERSTGAASIYRLSDLSFNMDKDSFTMSGTAYYYGDSIVPGELPTDTATQTVAPTVNLIPEMASNTAPSGVARASSIYTSNYEPWQAFNSHSDDYYWNSITNTGWIEYQFPEKTIVDKYMLKARQLTIYNDAMPRDWTFEAFDGEKWIVLDRQTGQTNWGVYQSRTYLFVNTTAYSKYRLNVSRNDGYMRLQLEQLAMYYGGGA